MIDDTDTGQQIALVLGAGGTPGAAWIRGCLEELEVHTGFRPEHANVIVGTSVGALAGGSIAAGPTPSSEILQALSSLGSVPPRARPVDVLASAVRIAVGLGIAALQPRGKQDSRTWVKRVEPATMCIAVTTQCRPPRRAGITLSGLRADSTSADPDPDHTSADPDSTDRTSADSTETVPKRMVTALAASCAAPFATRPVEIDGHKHLDGALWSSTNADIPSVEDHDVLIVIAPQVTTGTGGSILSKVGRFQLSAELRRWAAANKPVLVLHPTGEQYKSRKEAEPHRASARQLVRRVADTS